MLKSLHYYVTINETCIKALIMIHDIDFVFHDDHFVVLVWQSEHETLAMIYMNHAVPPKN